MRVGNRKDAATALALGTFGAVPDEWERLSGGSMRAVMLHRPSGVVYKVENWRVRGFGNGSELANLRRLRKESWTSVRIPNASGYSIGKELVLAMEYVPGVLGKDTNSPDVARAGREELYSKGRLSDMHGENFIVDKDEKVIPIDLGSERKTSLCDADTRVLTACGGNWF